MSFTKGAFFEDEDIYRQMDNLLCQFLNYFTHPSIFPSLARRQVPARVLLGHLRRRGRGLHDGPELHGRHGAKVGGKLDEIDDPVFTSFTVALFIVVVRVELVE